MAPISRSRTSRAAANQSDQAIAFGRVTKASKLNCQPKLNSKQNAALEELLNQKSVPQERSPEAAVATQRGCKRRRDSIDSEPSTKEGAIHHTKPAKKLKSQQQLATPPASSPHPVSPLRSSRCPKNAAPDAVLPETLQHLILLHKSFLRALSIYYAHDGIQRPASLFALLPSITRLWKKSSVCQSDIERILAVWEIVDEYHSTLKKGSIHHICGPFKLLTAGVGSNSRTSVEFFTDQKSTSFDENDLQQRFEGRIDTLYAEALKRSDSFFHEPLENFPRLICEIGSQTTARQEKIGLTRREILGLDKTEKNQLQTDLLSGLSISDPSETLPATPPVIKSRTLSLFDRVRAKQLAGASSDAPTPAAILRRRALSRIADITDTLRMKQAQKLSAQFQSDINGSTSHIQARMKVSFSLDALIKEIKNSLPVPVADEEIKECLYVMGREIPDTWCSMYEMGGIKCITLQGEGKSGVEMKKYCDKAFAV